MDIKIETSANIRNYEGEFELSIGRKREDIQQLLKLLFDGKSLNSIFPNKIIADNVKNFLRIEEYLNDDGNITAKGKSFLQHPYLPEREEGLYSIDVSTVSLQGNRFSYVTNIQRKLSPDEREEGQWETNLEIENEFLLGNGELAIYDRLTLKSGKVFVAPEESNVISFDLLHKKYTLNHQTYALSDTLVNYLMEQLTNQLGDDHYNFDNKELNIIVDSLSDFSDKDLLNGVMSKYEKNGVMLTDIPLKIISKRIANRYIYFCLYDLLMKNNFYTIPEMNEFVQNEILTGVISHSLRETFYDFVVTEDGFKENLPNDQYEKLQYRLNIVKELLGVDMIRNDDNSMVGIRNYDQMIQRVDRKFGNRNVSCVYLVMGYAFAKVDHNDFLQCANVFKSNYDQVCLVNKKNSSAYKSDPDIEEKTEKMGVLIKTNPDIQKSFHDRYIIFKMKNGTFKVFMCTCEIGQFFNPQTGETKGYINEIPQSDIVKKAGSLLNMVGGNND